MAESSLRDLDVSPEITDGSSTGEITRLIICEVLLPSSSVTETVNESLPKKLGAGVYVQFPSVGSIIDDPLFGAVVMEKYEPSVNPSISVALRSPVTAESSLRDLDVSPEITDESSTGFMVRFMVIESLFSPSDIMTEKVSDPWKLVSG